MGVRKVTLNGVTLMDVTDKTVDTDNLLAGNSALRNDGESITGAVVTASPSDASPAMDGTASAGVATTYSRGDHVHPSDTNKANINNPSFTGIPTAPTASKGTDTTQIATTAFVQSAITDINYPVTSVNSKTGTVVLTASDVNALPDDIEVPTKTSDLTNDSGYITNSDIPVTSVNTKTGAVVLTAADVNAQPQINISGILKGNGTGTITAATAGTDYQAPLPSGVSGSGTADWLSASQTPTAYQIPRYDSNSYLYSTTPSASDNSTKVATTAYVDSAISGLGSILNYKGTKATESALPSTGNVTGDVWIVSADNSEYVWNGTAWEKLGPTIDLSGYVPTTRTVNGKALSTDISLDASDVGALPDSTVIPDISGKVNKSGDTMTGNLIFNSGAKIRLEYGSSSTYTDIGASGNNGGTTIIGFTSNLTNNKVILDNIAAPTDTYHAANKKYVDNKVAAITIPVTSVNSKTGDVVLTAADVGALPDTTAIPTATSDLTNDSGFITSSDIPVISVNNKTGAVSLTASDIGALPSSTDLSVYMQKGVDYVTAGQKSGTTLGERATAEGWSNTSSGYYSHTEGQQNSVSGNSSHAEGSNNTVTSDYAHAEGGNNTVSGNWAHAEGRYNTASGNHSHAEGNETTASGARSHAEGEYTTANHKSQHVFGEYNILDSSAAAATARGTYVEIVGNGTADNARSNARTLDWSGNEVLAGKLTVGAGPTNNMDVATKQYVDSKEVPPEIFWITVTQSDSTYTSDKTFTEIKAAHDDGKLCLMIDPSGGVDRVFRLHYVSSSELSFTRSGKTANGPFIQDMTMGTDNSWTLVTQYAQNRITASGLLKGDGSGGVTAAAASDIPSLNYVSKVTSSDNAVVRFNGTSGEVQNSGVTIDDNNVLLAPAMGTSTNTYIEFPDGGGFRTTGSTQTGYLKITLPQSWTDTMMSFKVQMYQYNQNTSCEFTIGGYNYSSGGGTWANRYFAYSIGKSDVQTYSNLTVRLGHDGTKCAVYIGEANTSWQYMQIQVHDVLVGYKNYEYDKWATGWSVGFTTTLGTVTATITNPCVSHYAATAGTATSATSATSATTATTAGASKALNFVQTNELLLGNTNAQNRIWINYRRVENGATSGNTAITEYHFGNGNAGTTGVTLYAANFSGVAAKATAANVTTTANALAVYSDTTGTFSGKASGNGALYATAANGAWSVGALPIAQGGTGKTTAADAWTALGGGASGKHADSYFALASHNHAAGDINSGTLGVARGGTGAASFTANCVIMSNTTTTGALTTRAVTNNTSATALAANTNIPTQNTVYYGLNHRLNRTTAVNAADTGYTTIMARGTGLRNADTNPSLNGAINWTYG